jgi:signal transduction histidine kinase
VGDLDREGSPVTRRGKQEAIHESSPNGPTPIPPKALVRRGDVLGRRRFEPLWPTTRSAVLTRAIKILLVAVAYYVAGRLGLQLSLVKENVTPLWPPTGIALVAFLILGPEIWPGVALGALAVNLPISTSLWAAGATAAGNTLAPFVAAKLLGRVGFRKELDRLRDAIAIVFLGALLAMLISATVGTGILVLSGAIPPGEFLPAWAVWWAGDAMGVLVVAPFLLSLFLTRDRSKASWGRRAEAIGLFIALTLISLGITQAGLRLFIVFPVLGWAAWRFEQRGAAPAALIIAGCATWAAAHGWGPFEGSTLLGKMLTLQAFNAAVAFSSFFFAAMVTERVRAREALEMAAADLEQRVIDRTSALAAANERLSSDEGALRTSLELFRATDEQRRLLLARVVTAQEEERARIAVDVHDDSIQIMSAVELQIATLLRTRTDQQRQADLRKLQDTVRSAIGRLRNLMFELRPRVLDEEGLAPALRVYLRVLRDQTGIQATLEDHLAEDPPSETRVTLYRIAQEALTNVRKHSRASRASVSLHPREGGVLARIEDDGIGFDVGSVNGGRPGHVGLVAMRERAEMGGGTFRIESEPGRTMVEYWLPERVDPKAPRSLIDQVATIPPETKPSEGGSSSPKLVFPEVTGGRTEDTDAASEAWSWGLWRGRAISALPDRQGRGSNFGLHNRDLPTLWALDQLASRVAHLGEPVQWKDFNHSLRARAQIAGEWLRARDRARPHTLRAATGFPKPGPKASLSEDRFIMANVAHRASSREGPFQVLGLASFVGAERIAPTEQGLRLLGRLLDAGLSNELPHGPEVLWPWWSYLEEAAPAERRAWAGVLRELRTGPTRVELISRFPEWPGTTAETNCMGFVSRSREWGLVQPRLLDGRYLLTALGVALIEQEEARRPARSEGNRAERGVDHRRVLRKR